MASDPTDVEPMDSEPPKDGREVMKAVLAPLLEDFVYWFERSQTLLETEQIEFLGAEPQAQLLERVKTALQQVHTSKTLLQVTDGQAGVEMSVVTPWHQLVHECWGVAMRYRQTKASQDHNA